MIELSQLPALNAILNSLSAVLILIGYVQIKGRNIRFHRAFMVAACATSTLFLISYLIYHFNYPTTRFRGEGWVRPLYFFILFSHIVLAAAIVPLVLITLARALGGRYAAHRRIARWTFPIWIYVSVTGVIVYLMLYQLYPAR
jgi:putative membrane protein